ncbi:MAG: hypothetical protein ABR583_07540 [Gaiellaceae bacterium]
MPETVISLFTDVIQDHLELKQKNADLEFAMPLSRYRGTDPFQNHPLFKTEEQARFEDTLDGGISLADVEPELAAVHAHANVADEPSAGDGEGLWSRSRDFDWGD